jgi:hypothetical protein
MYGESRQVWERQRELRAQAAHARQASHLQALHRATRRAERAERRLASALSEVVRARSNLRGTC